MLFNYKYAGTSGVVSDASKTDMNFAPDAFRDPTFFVGDLNKHIPFREAISALHEIVVSDLRFIPKDREDYFEWVKEQESVWLAEALAKQTMYKGKVDELQEKLTVVRREKNKVLGPFHKARSKYFKYLYKKDYDAWFVLDPVITIHPDEIFFECFSQDESSYGKLGCNHNVFDSINEIKYGTTNIDYSAALYNEFQKIRDYKNTRLSIDPEGFSVQTTNEENYREVKIDLPESWVRGFLQVSSAMSIANTSFELAPVDLYNIFFILKRHKEKKGPRAIKYVLKPGEKVQIILEPWNTVIQGSYEYTGSEYKEIRVWGRRRMLTLERLLPIAKSIKVHLLGTGLPSFYVVDLGEMNFTLGLSGWTANDWSKSGNFDLMAPRYTTDGMTQQKVLLGLHNEWLAGGKELSKTLNLETKETLGSLSALIQAGKVIYDLNKQVYRFRALSNDELPLDSLRFANEREAKANKLVRNQTSPNVEERNGGIRLRGVVKDDNRVYDVVVDIDADERLTYGKCSCSFYAQNQLRKGPCEHMLALRIKNSLERSKK